MVWYYIDSNQTFPVILVPHCAKICAFILGTYTLSLHVWPEFYLIFYPFFIWQICDYYMFKDGRISRFSRYFKSTLQVRKMFHLVLYVVQKTKCHKDLCPLSKHVEVQAPACWKSSIECSKHQNTAVHRDVQYNCNYVCHHCWGG